MSTSAISIGSAPRGSHITLYGFGPFLGAPDSSPFVIKVMMLLKLAGLDYATAQGNPLSAPKKLLPYILDEGDTIADSDFIRRHIEKKYSVDFDGGLDAAQSAEAWAIERMCEDHLYFAMLETRWLDKRNFKNGVGTMFGIVPSPLRPLAKVMLRRKNAARLYGHGLGRHTKQEIAELAIRDIDALAAFLGEKPYLMGNRACAADAAVFGMVTSILTPALDSPLRASMMQHANLASYRDRLTNLYFPDYAAQGGLKTA